MNLFLKLIILAGIDVIATWIWVHNLDPDPSISIYILLVVPLVFLLNLLLAGLIYSIKASRRFAILFVYNSIISAVIMYTCFTEGIKQHQFKRVETWTFTENDTTFFVNRWKNEGVFDMAYSTSLGSSIEFLNGRCRLEDGNYILTTDSTNYKISKDYLVGFRRPNNIIKLEKR